LDAETRGRIEKWIDDIIEKQDVPETVKMILKEDYEVSSREDLALGYWLGYIMGASLNAIQTNKIVGKFRENTERRMKKADRELRKTMGEEAFKEMLLRRAETEKTAKRGRPTKVSLDNEDEEIRRILMSKIKLFREKMRREPYR
jgi:hypothetical protein